LHNSELSTFSTLAKRNAKSNRMDESLLISEERKPLHIF